MKLLLVLVSIFLGVSGHGMMLDPPGRSSLWRFDTAQPINYDDNELFCGGVDILYNQNEGKCGVCGDDYADERPRDNENTGTYGNGVIAKIYTSGSLINISILLTANHFGEFSYSLCVLDDPSKPEPEDCFSTNLTLADGSSTYTVNENDYSVVNQVRLPEGLICDRCVLRWHYNCGNSWGICADGTQRVGCGNQETFRSCADITIV